MIFIVWLWGAIVSIFGAITKDMQIVIVGNIWVVAAIILSAVNREK